MGLGEWGGAKEVAVGVPKLEGVLTSPCWTCRVREKMAMDSSYPAETREEGRIILDSEDVEEEDVFFWEWGIPEAMQRLRTDPSWTDMAKFILR